MNNLKPTYPNLLKAFIFSQRESQTEEEKEHVNNVIASLKSSEDWPAEPEAAFQLTSAQYTGDEELPEGYQFASIGLGTEIPTAPVGECSSGHVTNIYYNSRHNGGLDSCVHPVSKVVEKLKKSNKILEETIKKEAGTFSVPEVAMFTGTVTKTGLNNQFEQKLFEIQLSLKSNLEDEFFIQARLSKELQDFETKIQIGDLVKVQVPKDRIKFPTILYKLS